jgi:DNA-directed RNA polymerase specialized sigma24 family protein
MYACLSGDLDMPTSNSLPKRALGIGMARRVPKEDAATLDQVEEAIVALSAADLVRLNRYARLLAQGLGQAAKGRDHEDLLQEALTSVCSDDGRRWNPAKVDFVGFLKGAIKSISSNWRSKYARSGGGEIAYDDRPNDESPSPLAQAAAANPDPEQQAISENLLHRIEAEFASDEHVKHVIAGLEAGMTGPEVMEIVGMDENALRAATKRLRRGATRIRNDEEAL